jgi:adenosylmethionine-8-amino-7-oxononanoate aminotransferase
VKRKEKSIGVEMAELSWNNLRGTFHYRTRNAAEELRSKFGAISKDRAVLLLSMPVRRGISLLQGSVRENAGRHDTDGWRGANCRVCCGTGCRRGGRCDTPPPEYFSIIEKICRRFDVLLILDEVMTGFGRTGKNFAAEHWGISPDILVFAKGASAGYWPTAGAIVREDIYNTIRDRFDSFFPGHTYSNTPMMGVVGIKVLEYIEKNNLVEHVEKTSPYLAERLSSLKSHPIVGDVRGLGFLMGIEFVKSKSEKLPFDFHQYSKVANMVCASAFNNGLMVYPGGGTVDGYRGDHILIAPPLITQEHEIDRIVELLDQTLDEVESILREEQHLTEST